MQNRKTLERSTLGNIYNNYQEAFVDIICDIYSNPETICESRNGKMFEQLGVNFLVKRPYQYEFKEKSIGQLDYQYAEHFYDWMMSGSSAESTEKFKKKYPQVSKFLEKPSNSNLPDNFNSFYGERIIRQLPAIKKELQNENSRRAVLNILSEQDQILFEAVENDMTEYPCCNSVSLNIRDGVLYQNVHMRSNNMGKVAKLDMYLWGRFQKELADELNVECGSCSWSIVSAHIFSSDFQYFYNSGILNHSYKALKAYIHDKFELIRQKNIKIGVVRHAISIANEKRKLQGVTDTECIFGSIDYDIKNYVESCDKVYSSKLGRAIKTCQRYTNEFEQTELLNEMNWGSSDGFAYVDDHFSNYMNNFEKSITYRYYDDAESGLEMFVRLALFVTKLVNDVDICQSVAIFSHGIPLTSLICSSNRDAYDISLKPDHETLIMLT